ncbi:MAG: TM1812 family CRISPR-associated protein [Culicoidibacterales bacterium]
MRNFEVLIASMGKYEYTQADWFDEQHHALGSFEYVSEVACSWLKRQGVAIDVVLILEPEETTANVEKITNYLAKQNTWVETIPITTTMDYLTIAIEVQKKLQMLTKQIEQPIRMHLDVTNGFRTLPIVLEMVLQYVMTMTGRVSTTQKTIERIERGYTLYGNFDKITATGVLENITEIHFVEELGQALQQYQEAHVIERFLKLKADYQPLFTMKGQNENDDQLAKVKVYQAFFNLITCTNDYMQALKLNALRELAVTRQGNFDQSFKKLEQMYTAYCETSASTHPILDFLFHVGETIHANYAEYFIIMKKKTAFEAEDWQMYVENSQKLITHHYTYQNSAQFFTVVKEYLVTRMMYQAVKQDKISRMFPWDEDSRNQYTYIYNTLLYYLTRKNSLIAFTNQFENIPELAGICSQQSLNTDYFIWLEQTFFEVTAENQHRRRAFLKVHEYRNKINHGDLSRDGLNAKEAMKNMQEIFEALATYVFI